MGFDTIRESAELLITGWGELPIAYDNVNFDSSLHDSWVRLTVQFGDSFNSAISDDCIRNTGIVTVQIFVPENEGSSGAMQYAGSLKKVYANREYMDVIYSAPSLTRVGYSDGIYQLNLDIPYINDERLSGAPVTHDGDPITHNAEVVTHG